MVKAPRCSVCRSRPRASAGRVGGRAIFAASCTVCSLLSSFKAIEAQVLSRRCPLCAEFVEVRDRGFHCPRCGDFVKAPAKGK